MVITWLFPRHIHRSFGVRLLAEVGLLACVLLLMKLAAYWSQFVWLTAGRGAAKLRIYRMFRLKSDPTSLGEWFRAHPRQVYWEEISVGRKRLFTTTSDTWDYSNWRRSWKTCAVLVWHLTFKTWSLIPLTAIALLTCGTWLPLWLAVLAAYSMAAVTVSMLIAPLLNRITLGPFDQLNADLGEGSATDPSNFNGLLYPGGSALARYFATLVTLAIIGFGVAYAMLAHGLPHAFVFGGATSGKQSRVTDPIRWLYFSTTAGSTVGFGDITPVADAARVLVSMQLGAVAIVLTWIGTFFTSDPLPKPDQRTGQPWDSLERCIHFGSPREQTDGVTPSPAWVTSVDQTKMNENGATDVSKD